jgi:sugar phosphate isomerase/epimerase
MSADRISLQLYTLRSELDADAGSTFRRIAEIGFRQVELYGFVQRAEAYRAGLEETGMTAPSAHARLVGEDLDPIFRAAKELGVGTIYSPFIDESRWTSQADVAGIAADLNDIARRAADEGLRIGHHNHAFEFQNRVGGVSAFEALAADLDPGVELELDTYWAAVGGETDIPALLARLGERVTALHIKDGPVTPVETDQVAVGAGAMDFAPLLAAAPTALRVVELDDHTGDLWEAVAESHAYLIEAEGAA